MNEERIKQEREKEFFDTLEENLTKADIAFRAYERGYADAKEDIFKEFEVRLSDFNDGTYGYLRVCQTFKEIIKGWKVDV